MRIVISGASGYVGSYLASWLESQGVSVRRLRRIQSPTETQGPRPPEGDWVALDLGDPDELARAAEGCEAFVHCAARVERKASPRELAATNVAGTENAMNAAKAAGITRFIHMSCADVSLVDEDRVYWDESREAAGEAFGAYARSKRLAEELVRVSDSAEMSCIALRPAWLWGPSEGELLRALLVEGLSGGLELPGRGHNLFATTHLQNLASAVLHALRAEGIGGQCFYISDGEPWEARPFFAALSSALELPKPRLGLSYAWSRAWLRLRVAMKMQDGSSLEEMVRRGRSTWFNLQNAISHLGWQPTLSIDEGMKSLASWVRSQGGAKALLRLR